MSNPGNLQRRPSPTWLLPSLLTATSSRKSSGFQGRLLSKEPGIFTPTHPILEASLIAQSVKNLPAMQETQVQPLGWEDPLEKEMAPAPVLLPGESMDGGAWRATARGSPELDATERLSHHRRFPIPGQPPPAHGPSGHLPDVVAVHVLLGATVDDPGGQLLPTATAQHHPWQEPRAAGLTSASVPRPPLWAASAPTPRTSPLGCHVPPPGRPVPSPPQSQPQRS